MKTILKKKSNSGSSLMFVIIAVAFVGILGSIIIQATAINVEMKLIDKKLKNSFYTTETVMDQLNILLEDYSLEAMQTAYADVISRYGAISTSTNTTIRNEFALSYLKALGTKLSGSLNDFSLVADASGSKYTALGHYSEDELKEALKQPPFEADKNGKFPGDFFEITGTNGIEVTLDLKDISSERSLILRGVKVLYVEGQNEQGTATWIDTDIKIRVPNLNFESANTYPEFTKYAIIANQQLNVDNAQGNEVHGNIYAGKDGISVKGTYNSITGSDSLHVTGETVISRGDISVQQGGKLSFGDDVTAGTLMNIWTRSYETTSGATNSQLPACLKVIGNSYVEDDLSADGNYSAINFKQGNYYGYSFNKRNGKENAPGNIINSQYSSAVLINGKHISLLMDDLQNILLGGRAFVSRSSEAGWTREVDIGMGESVSVKANQTSYLIPNDYLAAGFSNPMPVGAYKASTQNPLLIDTTTAEGKKLNSLLSSKGFVTYYYKVGSIDINAGSVYFYFDFKNQASANEYFKDYFAKNKAEMEKSIKNNEYLSIGSNAWGVTISANTNLFTAANTLTADVSSGNVNLESKEDSIGAAQEDYLLRESLRLAKSYKSLQKTLTTTYATTYSDEPDDITDGSGAIMQHGFRMENKEEDPIFNKLITTENNAYSYTFVREAKESGSTAGFSYITGRTDVQLKKVEVDTSYGKGWAYFVAFDSTLGTSTVPLSTIISGTNKAGIIVTNGNIDVDCSFEGLIISNYDVQMKSSGSINLVANPELIKSMFTAQKSIEGTLMADKKFLHYFSHFANLTFDTDDSVDKVDASEYISYINWKKNDE